MSDVVIFIVTYNRLSVLKRTLDSYCHFTTPYEIVIIDNGTDDPESLAYLNSLPYKIYHFDKIYNTDQLEQNIANGVHKYYENSYAPYWAVSDCDICFEGANSNTLSKYIDLHNHLRGAFNVGPALRIDQIPDYYPLKNKAIVDSLYDIASQNQKDHHGTKYNQVPIDTTFCLFNAKNGTSFKRLTSTVRVNKPFAAHHLDWYIDINNMSKDQIIYMKKDSPIGSSGGSYIGGIYEDLQTDIKAGFKRRLEWCLKTEIQSYHLDPYILSWMYQFGIGCDINIQESKKWFNKILACRGNYHHIPLEIFYQIIYENNVSYLN